MLFFSRIFADLVGRFAPRRKELLVNSPSVLLTMATAKVNSLTLWTWFVFKGVIWYGIKLGLHFGCIACQLHTPGCLRSHVELVSGLV